MNENNAANTPKRRYFYIVLAGISIGLFIVRYLTDSNLSWHHLIMPVSMVFLAVAMRARGEDQVEKQALAAKELPPFNPVVKYALFYTVTLALPMIEMFGVAAAFLPDDVWEKRGPYPGEGYYFLGLFLGFVVLYYIHYLFYVWILKRMYGAPLVLKALEHETGNWAPWIQWLERKIQGPVYKILGAERPR